MNFPPTPPLAAQRFVFQGDSRDRPEAPAPETAADTPMAPDARIAELEAQLAAADGGGRPAERGFPAREGGDGEHAPPRRRGRRQGAQVRRRVLRHEPARRPRQPGGRACRRRAHASSRCARASSSPSASSRPPSSKAGIAQVDPAGEKFDPHRHEAMGQVDVRPGAQHGRQRAAQGLPPQRPRHPARAGDGGGRPACRSGRGAARPLEIRAE